MMEAHNNQRNGSIYHTFAHTLLPKMDIVDILSSFGSWKLPST